MLTKFKLTNNIQIIPFELNLRKDKWLFDSIYKPPLQNDQYFVSILSNLLDFYSNEYGNKVVLGGFNLEPSSPSMLSLMDSQNFVSLIKKKTKIFRQSHKPHINKTLRKAIMKSSQLKNKANKTKDPKDISKDKNNIIMWLN